MGSTTLVLAGDLGGTKTNLALFSITGNSREVVAEDTFSSGLYPGLAEIVEEFFNRLRVRPQRACFGVAGPVVSGQARITNLPWELNEKELAERLALSEVCLINDLQATACGISQLKTADLLVLNQGKPEPQGPIAVIAPGTGLGEGFLLWDGRRYQAFASEGGHADFAPGNALQVELWHFMQQRFEHVSYERLISGPGIPLIYDFLKTSGQVPESAALAANLAQAEDPAPVIMHHALDSRNPDRLCRAVLDLFLSILAAETANLALKVLATGGVYLGGGIPPRLQAALHDKQFLHAFSNKGRMTELLSRMPLKVILNPKTALLGAAAYALEFR